MNIIVTLLIAFIGFLIARKLNFPVPAMIGSMIFVGAYNSIFGKAVMPSTVKILTQGVAGIFIGSQMKVSYFSEIKKLYRPLILLLIMLTINTFIIGILIHFLFKIDITTSLLSCVSGGVTDISLISLDLGANTSTVALMQTSRLFFTIAFFPSWIIYATREIDDSFTNISEEDQEEQSYSLCKLVTTIVIAIAASYVGKKSGIPAGSLIFSTFTIMILSNYSNIIFTDRKVKLVSQILAGSIIGTTITSETIKGLPDIGIPIIILVISYWLVNNFYAYICNKYNLLDKKSAYFASCPAGASDMALIAGDIGADLSKIGIIQISRLIYSIAVMPQLIILFISFK